MVKYTLSTHTPNLTHVQHLTRYQNAWTPKSQQWAFSHLCPNIKVFALMFVTFLPVFVFLVLRCLFLCWWSWSWGVQASCLLPYGPYLCLGLKVFMLMFIAFPIFMLLVLILSFLCFDPLRCLHLCSLSPPYFCLGPEVFTLISIAFPPIDVFGLRGSHLCSLPSLWKNRRLCWTSRYMAMRISVDTISHNVPPLGAFGLGCSCLYLWPSSLIWVLGLKMFMSIVFLWFPSFYCNDKVHNFILS
jgi:hypothetical protein